PAVLQRHVPAADGGADGGPGGRVLVRWKDTPSRWLLGMLTPVLVASAGCSSSPSCCWWSAAR
ncbi:hypothetical protein ACXKGW_29130, partial [Klebsiella pneumoniae subsp. pneumoniae]